MAMIRNKILEGDCIETLKKIPSQSIDTIVTSPPYWGLRDYGIKEQIGLEPTLEEYHKCLLEVTAECKRVLKKTGTMFWVHGDSYYNASKFTYKETGNSWDRTKELVPRGRRQGKLHQMPEKCLTMQNYRLAERMVDEQGWILRNILIWHKKNHMPSSVKDRFTNAYEPVFFFSKSKKYWFDLDAIRVPHTSDALKQTSNLKHKFGTSVDSFGNGEKAHNAMGANIASKNPGDVFTLSTQPFPEAHFAVFPEKLIEPFIKAGCPAEVCKHCGFIRERIIERFAFGRGKTNSKYESETTAGSLATKRQAYRRIGLERPPAPKTIGWTDCACEDKNKYKSGIVLDPFMGAGTTAVVAKKLGRAYRGIELNPRYIEIACKRVAAISQCKHSLKDIQSKL